MRIALALGLTLLASSATARADSGAMFGETARAVSLADSVVARPGDTSALYFNPAGIADLERPVLSIYGHLGNRQLSFARDGELGSGRRRVVSGYGVSLVARLPGPEWLQRVRLGAAVHIPGGNVISVVAPVREDTPVEPYYGGRTDRTAANVALAVELPYGIRLGAAIGVTANLVAPTAVGFDARRGDDVDAGVVIDQDRDLTLDASLVIGARWQVIDELAFGLVWRQGGATRASGTFDIMAGAIVVTDEYNFYDLLAPEEVALGACVTPIRELSLSLDLTWGRWSEYRTIHDERPSLAFSDVLDVRAAAEWTAHPSLQVRLGYAFLPSPVPEQRARDNFLDAHRHEIAFGLGLDLEPLARFPLRVDLALRFHAQHEQVATKDRALLPDASASAGQTIDNLGYPGFRSRGSFAQVSLALTIALDGAPGARPEEDAPEDEPEGERAVEDAPSEDAPADAPDDALDDDALDDDARDDHALDDQADSSEETSSGEPSDPPEQPLEGGARAREEAP